MGAKKVNYKNCRSNSFIDQQSINEYIYKSIFNYIDKNSKKSNSTKEYYTKKYIEFINAKNKTTTYEGLEVKENNYSEINTLFPELFKIPFPQPKKPSFTYIDLFSGIGGFHQAMHQLNGKCLLSSEIDNYAVDTYLDNYGINSYNDITKIKDEDFPKHDVLCAGFPCQAFSKAGKQLGFEDQTKGTLFFQIVRILKNKKVRPDYIILENVRNLLSHDNGNTWKVIQETLDEVGYNFKEIVMSPHQLGVPQLRERVYILGIRKDLYDGKLEFIVPHVKKESLNIYESGIIDENPDPKYKIDEHEKKVLKCWDEFYKGIKETIIGFPIWFSEFRATYDTNELPAWKAEFCQKNRKLYSNNKDFIDSWIEKWDNLNDFTPTERKFEWQAGESIKSLWEGFIQFRPSGIRVKRPDSFPALVAIVQIPIIGKYKRRLTPREAARLQSFPDNFMPNANDHQAYKQFGNAVNVNCVKFLAEQLFKYGKGVK
ncbi:DNA (cytosine-5-)-methyltransferase [Treponema sp.]|uniref:DNA (cytosine-5-)-methyltransferase n=1 Tax=Treponema sp. TaxID=166 RepID=UPI00298EC2DB|nr:DNA (cytosine-5-)-methyltransferase [Treponema sp.]MCR5614254.1 DNA (cytosine-5-)-methyltransferase [Treponema sp.]